MNFAKVLEQQINEVKVFDGYELQLGVFEGKTERKHKVKVTNAGLLFIHENGSATRHIPPRPVLALSMQYLQSTLWPSTRDYILKHIFENGWTDSDVEKELKKMCIRLQSYASGNHIRNVHIHSGVKGTSSTPLVISVPVKDQDYSIDYYAVNSKEIILGGN